METASIKTIIIDDNKEYLFSLRENLALFPEVEIIGEATQYKNAKQLLLKTQPDLIFLDIEMPGKNGFELLNEVKTEMKHPFKVVFYTAYDKYIIDALRQSAFDYLVKPVEINELKEVLGRYKSSILQTATVDTVPAPDPFTFMVYLPVNTGIRFINRRNIVYFHRFKDNLIGKPSWEVLLNNSERIKLRQNISAEQILDLVGPQIFIKLNKSVLINRNYISLIEYKSRICRLIPPFDEPRLTISRQQLAELRLQIGLI
jgi:two-component system LytT family response regulator